METAIFEYNDTGYEEFEEFEYMLKSHNVEYYTEMNDDEMVIYYKD